jgi:hypothetical protein
MRHHQKGLCSDRAPFHLYSRLYSFTTSLFPAPYAGG